MKKKVDNFVSKGKYPDFIVAGFPKCGTTSLYTNLKKHSHIEMSPNYRDVYPGGAINSKEIHFFCYEAQWKKGMEWYKSNFNNNNKLQGEVSPNYLYSGECLMRIKLQCPDVKIIVASRDPVLRAFSDFNQIINRVPYNNNLTTGPLSTFKENIAIEMSSFKMDNVLSNLKKFDFGSIGILGRGLYFMYLQQLFKYFNRNQVMIIDSETMRNNMDQTYSQISKFLNIPFEQIQYDSKNSNIRTYNEILDAETEKKLADFYKPFNEQLFDLLGYKISGWK